MFGRQVCLTIDNDNNMTCSNTRGVWIFHLTAYAKQLDILLGQKAEAIALLRGTTSTYMFCLHY